MLTYNIDDRVKLMEADAPDTDEKRIAVLKFYDGFARGRNEAVKQMLSLPDQVQMDLIVDNGSWKNTTENISRIDVKTGQHDGDEVTLAIFHVGMEFEPQLWTYYMEPVEFSAEPTPLDVMNQLSGDDWIQAWFDLLAREMEIAMAPDEEIEIPQENFDEEEDTPANVGGSEGLGAPGRPGKRPTAPRVKPPGLPPGGPAGQ